LGRPRPGGIPPDSPAPLGLPQTAGMTTTTCPSWCHIKHPEGEAGPTLHFGPHWPPLRGDEGFSADVAAVQNKNGDVGVWLSAEHEEYLTTRHARSVARALLAAADWVDNNTNK
jgi:hypothetical protein